jgi:hypothetical protein
MKIYCCRKASCLKKRQNKDVVLHRLHKEKEMKIVLSICLLILFLTGCSVTSEKYRYQHRFDHYYNLLNQDEKALFNNAELDKLGASFDSRFSNDSKFSNAMHTVQVYEAIATFSGKETAVFFHNIILRELNRPVFYQFMNFLDSTAQESFVKKNNFTAVFEKYYQSNSGFKNFVDNIKKEYRLYNFSNEQVISFFRNISFPEVSRRELYHVLNLLKSVKALDDFRAGNIKAAAQKLDDAMKVTVSTVTVFNDVKKRSSLTKLDSTVFLDVYYNVIMKEMDPYALKQDLIKF